MNSKVLPLVDLETTGLDPVNDKILEFGVIVATWQLEELARKSWMIHWDNSALTNLSSYVRKMHTDNGLLKEVEESTKTLGEVEVEVMRFLLPYNEKGAKFVIGGNSVNYVRKFIEYQMPLLDIMLHYRVIDITSVGLLSENWTPETDKKIKSSLNEVKGNHRSMGDLDRCFKSAQLYKDLIFKDKP